MERLDRTDPIYKIQIIDLQDELVGKRAGETEDALQQEIGTIYSDGYNDKGWSEGYTVGFERGLSDGADNKPYRDIYDTDKDGQVDLPYGYGSERTIPENKKLWHEGYTTGYADGYRQGQLERKEKGLPLADPGQEHV